LTCQHERSSDIDLELGEEEEDKDDIQDEYDSGVNTDISLGTTAGHLTPPVVSLNTCVSSKILQLINLLQQEAYKYDMVS